ncbi:uncharacterized protein yc1106_00897 [Curvularia clavata]|uniref:Synaptobrevin homolog YKT6 n=1 Tax=Curvularia clavata TaxID=95742 RepID=A0A9Q8Z452_CURCL|nr:uncharacterized protein yc1106_00897 [Curvularia clavata]
MKLIYIGIFKKDTKSALELVGEEDLTSYNYFTRKSIGEFTTFAAGTIAQRTPINEATDVLENGYMFHTYAPFDPVCGVVITDEDYPSLAAHRMLRKVLDEFNSKYPRSAYNGFVAGNPKLSFPELKDYIKKYQDPENADSTMKIQKELDETKIVLHKTIESVLERGVKIDDLVQKSEGLSAQSKMFYTQAKKQNSCCTVM